MLCAATVLQTWNTVLNVLAVVVPLIILGIGVRLLPKYMKARDALAQLEEKDRAIETHQQTIDALTGRVNTLESDMRDLRLIAAEAQSEAKEWHARYDEQSRFTAEPALLEVRDSIKAMDATQATALTALG